MNRFVVLLLCALSVAGCRSRVSEVDDDLVDEPVPVRPAPGPIDPLPKVPVPALPGKWHSSPEAAIEESRRTGRSIFAYVGAEWCGPCQRMKAETLADPRVKDALKRFVVLIADADEQKSLVKRYRIKSLPTWGILRGDQELIAYEAGYVSADELCRWLLKY